jgi:hypothetical protein
LAHDVAVNPLNIMTAMAKKHYKVELLLEGINTFTVWASDEQEAQLLVQKGQGRDAGSKGPNVVGVKVLEMGAPQEENAAIIENAETEQNPTVKPLVEVIRG